MYRGANPGPVVFADPVWYLETTCNVLLRSSDFLKLERRINTRRILLTDADTGAGIGEARVFGSKGVLQCGEYRAMGSAIGHGPVFADFRSAFSQGLV